MTGGRDKERDFVEVLTADLADEVLEDDETLAEEVNDIGPALQGMIDRTKEMAALTIGRRRRELLRESGTGVRRRAEHAGTYDGLSREELWAEMVRRGSSSSSVSVSHRELEGMSEEDLRSALEEWDAAEVENGGES